MKKKRGKIVWERKNQMQPLNETKIKRMIGDFEEGITVKTFTPFKIIVGRCKLELTLLLHILAVHKELKHLIGSSWSPCVHLSMLKWFSYLKKSVTWKEKHLNKVITFCSNHDSVFQTREALEKLWYGTEESDEESSFFTLYDGSTLFSNRKEKKPSD